MNQQYNIQQNIFSLSKAVYPFEFKIVVKWPDTIIHNGIKFYKTLKEGIRISDGCPIHSYESLKDQEIWLNLDGEITEN